MGDGPGRVHHHVRQAPAGADQARFRVSELRAENKNYWPAGFTQTGVLVLDFNRLNPMVAEPNLFGTLRTDANGGDVLVEADWTYISGNKLSLVICEELGVDEAARYLGLPLAISQQAA